MKVGVVGIGYVGLVTAACLADSGVDVICVDKDAQRIKDLDDGVIPIYEPGLREVVHRTRSSGRLHFTTSLRQTVQEALVLFVAVGTPSAEDGSADLSAVLKVAGDIAEAMDGYRIIVVKSTVPVGTHKAVSEAVAARTAHPFDYVSNPEFLKEGSAIDDFMKPERVIIGTVDPKVREIMRHLYAPFMRRKERILFMDPASAELTKYAANCMLATRISFMNELSVLCEQVGADVELVRAGIGSDARIGNAFLFAGVGFGGSCFPKDVRALIHTGEAHGCSMDIVKAVRDVNLRQQSRFARRIVEYYVTREGEKVRTGEDRNVLSPSDLPNSSPSSPSDPLQEPVTLAVWGLAFKARTDDVRESPALFCVQEFLKAGFSVRAYDPEAMPVAQKILGDAVTFCRDYYEAVEGTEGLVVLTDWQQFRNPDFERIAGLLKRRVLFDGRNLYEPDYVREKGLEYHCVGRPSRT